MGSKIPDAATEAGNTITAIEFEKSPCSKLFCSSPDCDAELSFVKRHNRKYSSKTIEISPCFRLKRNRDHSHSCKYNLCGQLKIIAQSSTSGILSATNNSKYEFRLHILLKALQELTNSHIQKLSKAWGVKGDENKSFTNRGKLTNYLRTLKQILELRTFCEDNAEIRDLVILDYKGKKISWNKFYFDHSNLVNFAKYNGDDKPKIPLAIAGHIHQIKKPTANFDYNVVVLHSPFVDPDENNVIKKPIAEIILKEPSLVDHFDKNNEYLFFGLWTIKERTPPRKDSDTHRKFIYENIEMYIDNEDHFLEC